MMYSHKTSCSVVALVALSLGGCSGAESPMQTAPITGAGSGAPSGGAGSEMNPPDGTAGTSGASGMAAPVPSAGTGSAAGASGSSANPEPEVLDPNVDWTALSILYPTLYSAYDGVHTFQVPAHVDGATVELSGWRAIPSSAVSFDPDPDTGGVIITILEPVPEVTIAASNGPIGGTAPLYITSATPEEWELGEFRYHNGAEWELPAFDPADFDIFDPMTFEPPAPPTDLSCVNCHTTGAKYFEIQHTPTQVSHISDDELIAVFTMGIKPERLGFRVLPESFQDLYVEMHTWNATDEEKKGLVVYLRSLTPEGQGDILLPDGSYAPPDMLPDFPMP